MSAKTKSPQSVLPKPPRPLLQQGAWVRVLPDFLSVASFGELDADEPDARLYGRIVTWEGPGGRAATARTFYVQIEAAADCSYGHHLDERRPLPYTPGHAGLTADLPRKAIEPVTDPRLLGWLEICAGETKRARAIREAGADIPDDYYRGSQLLLKVGEADAAVRLSSVDVSVTSWGNRRYADGWATVPFSELEYEPEDADEVEFERWETVYGVISEDPGLLDGLHLLWALA